MATLKRRLISIPATVLLLPVFIFLAPLAILFGSIFDVLTGRFRMPSARLWLFAIALLSLEIFAVFASASLRIAWPFNKTWALDRAFRIQGWWAGALLFWAKTLLGIKLDCQDFSTIPQGQVIIASRHASPADAVIPAWLFAKKLNRPVHYVLKKELQWMPSIDCFGPMLGNHFVTRGGDVAKEVAQIKQMIANSQPNSALIIFPEGTYSTAPTQAKVRKSLAAKGNTEVVALADELVHLLPPKLAGTEAYLEAAPEVPVIVMGHHGLEGVAQIKTLRKTLPRTKDVLVRWWEIERPAEPSSRESRQAWLFEHWRELDGWVQTCSKGA